MPSPSEQHGSDPAAPALNRAARRARGKRKGATSSGQPGVPQRNPGVRGSQDVAPPRLKGRRGDR